MHFGLARATLQKEEPTPSGLQSDYQENMSLEKANTLSNKRSKGRSERVALRLTFRLKTKKDVKLFFPRADKCGSRSEQAAKRTRIFSSWEKSATPPVARLFEQVLELRANPPADHSIE